MQMAAQGSYTTSTKQKGDAAEDCALQHLQAHGLRLVHRNYRTPGRGGGEIDLIMRETDGTLVFVEVRQRRSKTHGGAASSVTFAKQKRIIFAARSYIAQLAKWPPCRFDVVALEDDGVYWYKAAFDTAA
jgi:putative endonuclease